MTRPGRRAVLVALALAVVGLGACSSDQAPEIAPNDGQITATTSRLLEPCPPGGPDDTTPTAGCLAEDGSVLRP